jgi:thymidylate kinase
VKAGGAADQATTGALHPALAAAFDALDRARVPWLLLRGNDQLRAPKGDVDLLIDEAALGGARRALGNSAFVEVPSAGRASHRFFVAFDGRTATWVELDIVTELAFGRRFAIRTATGAGCLGRRIRHGSVSLPTADDAFWTLLCHCLLDRGNVPPRHAERLAVLAESARSDGPLATFLASYAPASWTAERMRGAASALAWPGLLEIGRSISATWSRSHRFAFWSRVIGQGVRGRTRALDVAIRGRGIRMVLLGPDGAGKSSVAAAIAESFYLPTRTLYAGLAPATDRASYPLPGIRMARLLFRLRWRSAVARWHQLRGRLVIFDRYSYDALTQPPSNPALRLRRWLLARAAARPDVTVLLDAPAALMHERKSEFTPDQLEAQRERFLRLRDEVPELVIVDAAGGLEDVRRQVVALAWERYGARRSTRPSRTQLA